VGVVDLVGYGPVCFFWQVGLPDYVSLLAECKDVGVVSNIDLAVKGGYVGLDVGYVGFPGYGGGVGGWAC